MTARIALVRHGETDWNRQRRIQGRSDIPLNDTGRLQARQTGLALRGQGWQAVYTSPLSRASETALIIADELGLDAPTPVDALIERDYGEAEGCTAADLDRLYPGLPQVPGRESRAQVADRAVPSLIDLAGRHDDGRVLTVTHGGLIRSVLLRIEPADGAHHTEPITNGSVHTLEVAAGAVTLIRFAEELTGPGDDDITEQNVIERREPAS